MARKQRVSPDETAADRSRKSEQKISSILANITDCHYELDRNFCFILLNDQCLAYLSRKKDELIGRSYWDVFPSLKGSIYEEQFDEVLSKSTSIHFDAASILYPGKWIEFHAYPTEDGGISAFFRDITKHKCSQEALLREHERLELAQIASGAGIWDWDIISGHLTWSPQLFELFGLELQKNSASFDTWSAVLHPDDREMANMWIDRALREGMPLTNEYRVVHPDGQIRWISARGRGTYNEYGHPVRMTGICIDITEIKNTEEKLAKANEQAELDRNRLEAVLGATPSAVVLVEASTGRFSYMNRRAMELYGKDYVGSDLNSHVAQVNALKPDGTPYSLQEMPISHSLKFGKEVHNEEMIIERADGTRIPVLVSSAPLFDAKGNVASVIVSFDDITSQKDAENNLRRSAERLAIISDTASQLLMSKTPQLIVEDLCHKVMKYLDCHVFFNFLIDGERNCLRLNAYAGIPEETAREIRFLDYGVAVCGCAARDACKIVAENIPTTPDIRTDLVRSFGVTAYACHPLFAQGQVIGTLSFGTKSRLTFTDDELSLMKTVADQVATAMERIRLLRSAEERADDLEQRVQERTAEVKLALVETAQERKRLYDVLETLPAYVTLLAPDYRMPFTNRIFRDLFGDPEDKKCFEHLFGRTEPCEICHSYKALKTSKPQQWQWTGPNGRTYDIHDYPFTDTDGSPLILEMGMDMTDWMRAQEEIRFAYAYNRSLIEASIDPLVTINPRGLISDVNMATEHVTGYARDELIGTDFCDYFTDREKARTGYKQVFRDGIVRDYELEILHKDGRTTPVLYNASVYRGESGNVIGVFAAARDVTEQRQLEGQLRQAHKMEAIGTLAGGIAHDFNNILTGIIGFAEIVEEDLPPGSPITPRIQRVLKAAYRGKDLVKQILAFSRKSELTRKPVSLSLVTRETVDLLRASLPATIEIHLSIKATRDTILANPSEIQQIVMNIATNAAYAMRETGGTVSIGLTDIDFEPNSPALDEDLEPGAYVQLAIMDTGIGMEPHIIKRLFEPFFTTKEVGQGTGMGLPVVYGIVKSLHGAITVESEPGIGSTFRVFIPAASSDKETKNGHAQKVKKGSERILFIDDEDLIMEWGQAALERLGYTVTALTDSTGALKLFSSDPTRFDLVITDQTMPRLTGLNLAKKLLKIRPDIRIILCTGHSDSVSSEKAQEEGIKEFLMKPLGRQELAEAVRRVLNTTEPEG